MRARVSFVRAFALTCVACVFVAFERASAQTTGTNDGASAFARSGDYAYKICSDQVGTYASASNASALKRAKCVSIDRGELGFCSNVAWDACARTDPPLTLDKRVSNAFDTLTLAQTAMYPALAGDVMCLVTMAEYACALAFPRCDPDPLDEATYYELPACWSYCMNSVFACTGDMAKAKVTCNASLASGAVAPDGRPDIRCTSAAAASAVVVAVAVAFASAFVLGG